MKLLLTFAHISYQKGSFAQVKSLVSLLPDDVEVALFSHYPVLDSVWEKEIGIKVIPILSRSRENHRLQSISIFTQLIWIRILLYMKLTRLAGKSHIVRTIVGTDKIFDLSGDSYKDYTGGFSPYHNLFISICNSLNRETYLISQSIGPFRKINRKWSRKILNSVKFIYMRENGTKRIIDELGVSSTSTILPDVAFALPYLERFGINERNVIKKIEEEYADSDLVLLSLSHVLEEVFGESYFLTLEDIIRTIKQKFRVGFVLIPHDIKPLSGGKDDRSTTLKFIKYSVELRDFINVDFDFDPSFVKNIASKCLFGVAGRMHAGIACLSSNTPCLFMSWSHKYAGLLEAIGQKQSVVEMVNWDRENTSKTILDFIGAYEYNKKSLISYNQSVISKIKPAIEKILKDEKNPKSCSGGHSHG